METFKEGPVAKRLRSKMVNVETSNEEPVAKRLASKIAYIKTSKGVPLAKRPRLQPQNNEEIIGNVKARIQALEEQLKILESEETEIESLPVPELPDEMWLEIMTYLSTYDVLKTMACVSKRFHKLSKDPNVIRKIEVDPVQSWPTNKEEKYCDAFLRVLKRSRKLNLLYFGFSWDIKFDISGEKFLKALPSMNHQFLREFHLKGDGKMNFEDAAKFINPLNRNLLKYLQKCSGLKILKFLFKPEIQIDPEVSIEYPFLSDMVRGIKMLNLKKLQELHLIGIDINPFEFKGREAKFLERIAENMPKLQRLCLTYQDNSSHNYTMTDWNKIFTDFASRRNIELEITMMTNSIRLTVDVLNVHIFGRIPLKN